MTRALTILALVVAACSVLFYVSKPPSKALTTVSLTVDKPSIDLSAIALGEHAIVFRIRNASTSERYVIGATEI